jgi:hypothetical protein
LAIPTKSGKPPTSRFLWSCATTHFRRDP